MEIEDILRDPRWREILEDKRHGASVLIDWALEFLRSHTDVRNGNLLVSNLERQLKQTQAGIPSLVNLCRLIQDELNETGSVSLAAERLEQRRIEHKRKVIAQGTRLVCEAENIISISYSGLVRNCLISAKAEGAEPTLFIGEGRPKMEGLLLATELASKGIKCYVFPDIAFREHLEKVRLVMVGADAVFDDTFINKIGTCVLLDTCKSAGIKTSLIYDFTKIVPPELKPSELPLHNPTEITGVSKMPDNLYVINRYFEEVSLSLIDVEIGRNV